MTAGTNGEPEDPYGYLYRPAPGEEPAEGAGTTGAYGSPANRMMPQYVQVGQMNYGQPPPAAQTQPQAAVPARHEHAGAPPREPQPPQRRGGGSGGRGAVIGATVAILVVIGVIAAVLLTKSDGDKKEKETVAPTPSGQTAAAPAQPDKPTSAPSTASDGKLVTVEAEDASPSGGAAPVGAVPNSTGSGMLNMEAPGSTVTVKVNAPKAGVYYLSVKFVNAAAKGDTQNLSIVVNGTDTKNKAKLKSYGTPNSTTGTWNKVTLKEGANDVALTCGAGDSCKVALDSISVGDVKPDFS
ncbi:CBM35 domain-containing protein [Streptomyces sp. SID3343]|uniref:CBM35 domain-containing protein n=1 Tax=Streptomyces sp. SID3343 TaxID=2690260 RepID=UPI001371E19D|nr:CBM35 domain-containing protein [Streptomyces sp. SID3343]MYW06555.1 hypothetical protein [Streptomyces sp. SID3343]